MSKGAAKENTLGGLHGTLARVFQKVLEKYELNLEAVAHLRDNGDLEDEMITVLAEIQEPNPAMLSAVSKFLKDNDIMYDTEEIDKLNAQQRRLEELKKKRGKVVNLNDIKKVDEG